MSTRLVSGIWEGNRGPGERHLVVLHADPHRVVHGQPGRLPHRPAHDLALRSVT